MLRAAYDEDGGGGSAADCGCCSYSEGMNVVFSNGKNRRKPTEKGLKLEFSVKAFPAISSCF